MGRNTCVCRIVKRPVSVQQTTFRLHLPEQGRGRIGGQDVERRALQPVPLDPGGGPDEDRSLRLSSSACCMQQATRENRA